MRQTLADLDGGYSELFTAYGGVDSLYWLLEFLDQLLRVCCLVLLPALGGGPWLQVVCMSLCATLSLGVLTWRWPYNQRALNVHRLAASTVQAYAPWHLACSGADTLAYASTVVALIQQITVYYLVATCALLPFGGMASEQLRRHFVLGQVLPSRVHSVVK